VGSEIAEAYYPSDNEEVESVASDEVYPSEETDDEDVAGVVEAIAAEIDEERRLLGFA